MTQPLSDTNPLRVNDGTSQGGLVAVDCAVVPNGNTTFQIQLSAAVQNQLGGGGGAMTIVGTVDPSTGGTGVYGTFANGPVQYTDTNCTITYTYDGVPFTLANYAADVAAGRIWAHIDCPNASAQNLSGQNLVCDANADFVFENCGG